MSASMRLFGVVCGLRDNPRTTLAAVLEMDGASGEGFDRRRFPHLRGKIVFTPWGKAHTHKKSV